MMRHALTMLLLLAAVFVATAQAPPPPTDFFDINGRVKTPVRITLADLAKYKTYNLGDVVITNHLGEVKSTAKNLSGVLLRDMIATVTLDADNPKHYSEYYFICRASDGYTVVYSWNELFNTATGNSAYLVTEQNGQPIAQSADRLLMISTQDQRTGRRYVKNLQSITVGRADNR